MNVKNLKKFRFKKAVFMLPALALLGGCATHQAATSHQIEPVAAPIVTASHNITPKTSMVGRYISTLNVAKPDQMNPLLTVATFKFTPNIANVGQAVNQVLQYSGYSLAPHLSSAVQQTLKKPLPYSVRELGPLPIQDALNVLMGQNVFILVADPLHRLVNFDVNPDVHNALYPPVTSSFSLISTNS